MTSSARDFLSPDQAMTASSPARPTRDSLSASSAIAIKASFLEAARPVWAAHSSR
jgi:hypothetical protein